MPAFTNLPIAKKLDVAQQAITNGRSDQLQEFLAPAGYTPERLDEGQAVLDEARTAYEDADEERTEKKEATRRVRRTFAEAQDLHAEHVAFARPALRDEPGIRETLKLDEARKRTHVGFVEQARRFYGRALADPDVLAKLTAVGLTQADLEEGLAAVNAVESSRHRRGAEKGESEDATDTQGAEVEDLEAWIGVYRDVAKAALRDRPELVEQLGFMHRS